jgi:hypothetical protein
LAATEFKNAGGSIITVAYQKSDRDLADLGNLATPGMALSNTDGALTLLQEFTQSLCVGRNFELSFPQRSFQF